MLTWLNIGALPWLLLVPALLALYILRQHPLRRRVPSLRLWATLPQVEQARPRLRQPPLSLLLILQALLLLLGAFALMQPALTAPAGRYLVVAVDASGSMQASNGGTTRFTQALDKAREAINGAGARDQITVLRAAGTVTTACSDCSKEAALASLNDLRVGAGDADLRGALGIAAELSGRWGQNNVDTVLVSDGSFDAEGIEILPESLRFERVGTTADNRAITVISARQPPDGSPGYSVYARVENFGRSAADVTITSLADTIPQPERRVNLPAGGHADLIWQLPAGTAQFTTSIGPNDALAADNRAVLMLPAGASNRVWIATSDSELYLRALAAIEGVQPVIGSGGGDPGAAIAIVNGGLPDPLPSGGVLLVDPTDELIPGDGIINGVRPLPAASGHPLLAGIDLQALLVLRARQIEPPSWLQTLVDSERGPLLLAGEYEGRRVAVLTFDPRDSNLTKLAAFPLLMANLVDWLYPLAGTEALSPGQTINLAPDTSVNTPSGRNLTVGAAGVFADTEEAGLYQISKSDLSDSFSVNMTDAQESVAALADHPELQREPAPTALEQLTQQQFWSPLAAVVLILLSGEWFYYCFKRGRA